jgi:hypothetical protein
VSYDCRDKPTLGAKLIAHGASHNDLDLCAGQCLGQTPAKVLQDNHRSCAAILELMRKFSATEQGTHLDKHKAGSNHARDCNWMLRQVGHHHRDAIWVLKSEALKIGGKMP